MDVRVVLISIGNSLLLVALFLSYVIRFRLCLPYFGFISKVNSSTSLPGLLYHTW